MRAKLLAVDTQVATSKVNIWGIILYPLTADGATVKLYNEATSSKTAAQKVAGLVTLPTALGSSSKEVMFPRPLICDKGLYVDLEGTNAVVYVYVD